MHIFQKIKAQYQSLTRITKRLLQAALLLSAALYITAIVLFVIAGRHAAYFTCMQLSRELTAAVRPCLGVLGIGALLFEAAASMQQGER